MKHQVNLGDKMIGILERNTGKYRVGITRTLFG